MQEKVKLFVRDEEVSLNVEPKVGNHIRVISGISKGVAIDNLHLEIYEQFYQENIKKALKGNA